jgi:hypothetical protein
MWGTRPVAGVTMFTTFEIFFGRFATDSPRAGGRCKMSGGGLGGSFDCAPGGIVHRWMGSRRRSAQDDIRVGWLNGTTEVVP